ncbi:site-specific integrase [Streptomyces sp. NPDC001719]
MRPVPVPDDPAQQRGHPRLLRVLDRDRSRPAGQPRPARPQRQSTSRPSQPPGTLPVRGADPLQPQDSQEQAPRDPRRTLERPLAALRSNRDRALLSLDISNAARASEALGLRGVDLDWGDQLVRVNRKGSDDAQWLPASPDAFVWLRLYLAELGPLGPNDLIRWTLRRRDRGDGPRLQPMNYEALRAVFRRFNTVLGANYTMHDLRHTAALRMSRDKNLTLLDVQTILGHTRTSAPQRTSTFWRTRRW